MKTRLLLFLMSTVFTASALAEPIDEIVCSRINFGSNDSNTASTFDGFKTLELRKKKVTDSLVDYNVYEADVEGGKLTITIAPRVQIQTNKTKEMSGVHRAVYTTSNGLQIDIAPFTRQMGINFLPEGSQGYQISCMTKAGWSNK